MTDTGQNNDLQIWGFAAIVGFVAFVLMMVLGDMGFLGSAFSAGLITVVLGALLWWVISRPLPGPAVGGVAAPRATESQAAAQVGGGETEAASDAADNSASIGERAGASAASVVMGAKEAASTAVSAVSDATVTAVDTVSEAAASAVDSVTHAAEAVSGAVSAGVTQVAQAGQDGAAAQSGAVFDMDAGQSLDDMPGTRPEALPAPRGGKADNLKEIKGIGPKLEKLCNDMGFYHFDQIANWTVNEIAWVNANLEGFKGRVTRDDWVSQARLLASAGKTGFSKRVEGGDVS